MTGCFRAAPTVLAAAMVLTACGDDTGPSQGFVVTGTIQNNTQQSIPANARIVVAWAVSSGSPDYSYLFGEGSFDPVAGTFSIAFEQPPPSAALNVGALGVGIIAVTTNQSVGTGDDLGTIPETEIIGVAGRHAVIYLTTPEQGVEYRDWAADFEAGYGVGVGVEVPGDFDAFQPVSASSVVLIIDDLGNIDLVNWT